MTDDTATTGEPADDRRAVTDGGRLVLRYGTPAESVGEPGKVFAQFDGEFVLLGQQVLDWGMIADNEVEPGVVNLDDVPGARLGRLRSATEPVEVDELAGRLAGNSGLDEFGAQVLLLFEGFELDPPEIASELSTAEEAVVEEIENIYNQYDENEIAATVQEHHPDIDDDIVRAFVLSRGFAWETDEIAADLGVDEATVEDHLDTAHEEHEQLEETLQEVI